MELDLVGMEMEDTPYRGAGPGTTTRNQEEANVDLHTRIVIVVVIVPVLITVLKKNLYVPAPLESILNLALQPKRRGQR